MRIVVDLQGAQREASRSRGIGRYRGFELLEKGQGAEEHLILEFHGDTNRTYLTGISMGGYGSWHLAEKYPDKFAAMVVICGGIHPPEATLKNHPELVKFSPRDGPNAYADVAAKVGKVPVWIFHGSDDNIVPVVESQRMADAMKTIGAEVHYTEYPGVKHVSWDKAYDEPKLYPWLYSKTLADRQK